MVGRGARARAGPPEAPRIGRREAAGLEGAACLAEEAGPGRSEPRRRVRAACAAPGARPGSPFRRSGYFRAGRFLPGPTCWAAVAPGARTRPAAALPLWSRASQEGGRPLKIVWAAAGRIRDGGCAAQPPTRFHGVHGAHVCLDASRTRATRVESFAHGLCFSHRPLEPGQIFLVEIEEKEPGWCGHLRVGLTAHDPRSLAAVPEYSLPDLVSLGDSWVFAITRNHNRVSEAPAGGRGLLCGPHLLIEQVRIPRDKLVGRSRPGRYSHILDELYKANVLPPTARKSRIGVLFTPQPDGTADMHIVINGEDMGPSARGLPGSRPLYAVVDIFASTKSVRIIQVEYGLPSLETLCRTAIQRHISHRLAIDGLNLPLLLKNLCKYE